VARPRHQQRSDGTIWTNGIGRRSSDRKNTFYFGHILRFPATIPASLALEWTPVDDRRRIGRPRKTWQGTLKEDLEAMGVKWSKARATASDRARWRQLVARCSVRNGRNYV